ncbi:MAG: hypothetical protein HY912_22335 [Desulfomonile tiedjei]|uniref:Dynamin family protein n=1 Tax=Desulfomonile tiedjei TaxID=2358 RepID=A0A9D6V630_9BACT|nr:hypothetical protein [Desulfomonile tiedjei]
MTDSIRVTLPPMSLADPQDEECIALDTRLGDLPEAAIWFPDRSDVRKFRTALGTKDSHRLRLETPEGPYLNTCLVHGLQLLEEFSDYDYLICCLHPTGMSDRRLSALLKSREDGRLNFFFRIFDIADLKQAPAAANPVGALWDDIRRVFANSAPCLILADDCEHTFRQWLARVLWSVYFDYHSMRLGKYLRHLDSEADNILAILSSQPLQISSVESLSQALHLRNRGQVLQSELEESENRLASCVRTNQRILTELSGLSATVTNDTARKVFGIDIINLGREILPELQRLIPDILEFSEDLTATEYANLRILGQRLEETLVQRPPSLAIVGPFSSGKTTLLNTLLFGMEQAVLDDNGNSHEEHKRWRAFRTSQQANTAIVSEMTFAPSNAEEKVIFEFRNEIDHVLVGPDDNGDLTIPLHGIMKALTELIRDGVLKETELRCELHKEEVRRRKGRIKVDNPDSEKPSIIISGDDECIRLINIIPQIMGEGLHLYDSRFKEYALCKLYLSAKVDINIAQHQFPREINLETKEGWHRFQGDGNTSKPDVESSKASFIVKTAHVQLRNPFLRLTTIADTPGTGAANDRHQVVTQQYLGRAEGLILLLPTSIVDSTRVRQILSRVAKECERMFNGRGIHCIRNVAFVVNVYAGHDNTEAREKIEQFSRMIQNEFQLDAAEWQRHRSTPENNFFVVNLADIDKGQNPRIFPGLGFPSLIPLREWIENLFRTGGYEQRFRRVLNLLNTEWKFSLNQLDERKKTIADATKRREKATDIHRFETQELPYLSDTLLSNLDDFKKRFDEGSSSVAAKLKRMLNDLESQATDLLRDDLKSWRAKLRDCLDDANRILDQFQDDNYVETWTEDIRKRTKQLDVQLPHLAVPPSGGVLGHWDIRDRFSIESYNSMFDEKQQEWPNIPWFQKLKELFGGQDKRVRLARDIRQFCQSQYDQLWGGLSTFLKACEAFADGTEHIVTDHIEARRNELNRRTKDETSVSEELQRELDAFGRFEEERARLAKSLSHQLQQ